MRDTQDRPLFSNQRIGKLTRLRPPHQHQKRDLSCCSTGSDQSWTRSPPKPAARSRLIIGNFGPSDSALAAASGWRLFAAQPLTATLRAALLGTCARAAPLGAIRPRWTKLASVGDVKRFLRWTILQLKANKLDRQNAAVLGQLGCYLLKAIEGNELAERVAALEKMIEARKK